LAECKTLKNVGESRKDIKNSVFLGYAEPVNGETEARKFIEKIKNRHKDAAHNVSAYIIKNSNELTVKYDDDGEPAGSSGKPVYKVMDLKNIQNAVVVVSRYFGGIKLGFGGLTRAYRETAIEAIENAGITNICNRTRLKIRFDYSCIKDAKPLIEQYGKIDEEHYSDVVEFITDINEELTDDFVQKLKSLTKDKVAIQYL
jgi:uncharacterized YigZ family protein